MIGLIINANARRVRRDPAMVERLSRYPEVSAVVTESADEVATTMQRFAADKTRIVAVCGGDGTAKVALRELLRAFAPPRPRPSLALLPAGTMNTISANLGIDGDPERVLERLVGDLRRGEPQVECVTSLLANGQPCFMFGAAMVARFLEVYYEKRASVARAARLALDVPLAALFGTSLARRIFAPLAARVVVDGQELEPGGWTLLVASTLQNLGLGVRVTYRGRARADRFQLIASTLSARRLALQFLRTFSGKPLRGPGHHDLLASAATMTFEQPQLFMTDGDLAMADQVKLEVGARVQLCVPR